MELFNVPSKKKFEVYDIAAFRRRAAAAAAAAAGDGDCDMAPRHGRSCNRCCSLQWVMTNWRFWSVVECTHGTRTRNDSSRQDDDNDWWTDASIGWPHHTLCTLLDTTRTEQRSRRVAYRTISLCYIGWYSAWLHLFDIVLQTQWDKKVSRVPSKVIKWCIHHSLLTVVVI